MWQWPVACGLPRPVKEEPQLPDEFTAIYRYVSDGISYCTGCKNAFQAGVLLAMIGTRDDPSKRRILCESCYSEEEAA